MIKEIYYFTGTEEDLRKVYFNSDWKRGGDFGWAHKVDKVTKELSFVDQQHADDRDQYKDVGGLKALTKDLFDNGLIKIKRGN